MFQNALYEVLKAFQSFTEPVLGGQSYWFAIVLLTLSVRTLMIPLTVKQFRSAKAMRKLAPELKALKDKHKGDTTKQAEAATALYREHGVSPLSGCLPLIAQAPFLFALFHVIRNPSFGGEPNILLGHTVFGIALDTRWMELTGWGARLGSVAGLTVLTLIALMTCTTWLTQRRMMAQAAAPMTGQQAAMMKVMPLMFPLMAVNFPLAVIIYWVTTNLWTMGQQMLLTRASGLSADEVAAVPALADPPANPGGGPGGTPKAGAKGGKPGGPRPGGGNGRPANGKPRGAASNGPAPKGGAAKAGAVKGQAPKPGAPAAVPANGNRPAAQAPAPAPSANGSANGKANPKSNGKSKGKKGAGARVPARAGTAKARRRR
jgi:YidC/Oxa1 family membrane protein insertase